jgi:very-short-patch-repair endonuclease
MGPYVLDSYCPSLKTAVEVDGWSHNMDNQGDRDRQREAWLADRGIFVIRYTNQEVMSDADGGADSIWRTLRRDA